MRKLLLLTFVLLSVYSGFSQNLSFSCTKDTVLGCGINCMNIVARFPDLRSLGTNYTVNNETGLSQCRPFIDPGLPGPSTNLTIDDRYSTVLTLPFSFPFFGTMYNSLIASTNGLLSFDISKTGLFSHYGILNSGGFLSATSGTPQDLPSTLYDKALIMAPYHDLNPATTTSPTRQIKFEVYGTAPNRKWMLSFYKVPLFLCDPLINNTHQIILYESTGVIEVFIQSKDICTTWNEGRAMIGMQDFNRTSFIMAPGRKASDAPWGGANMNETWRFIPSQGPTLYRKVELLNNAGAVIALGDTTRINANTFEWTFPNICPPANTQTIYVVKTTYQKIDDPLSTIYSLDTFRVLRNALPLTATSTNTTCGVSAGSITVSATGGTLPYQYSLNGGPGQASNVFSNLPGGTYIVTVTDATGCSNTITVVVTTTSSLSGTIIRTNASCPGVNNGTITVTPTSGTAPYTYSANGGPSQSSNIFTGLAPGPYTIIFTDINGCTGSVSITVSPGTGISGSVSFTSATCAGANNGTITVNPTSGTAPYQYILDGGMPQASNVFTGVSPGTHTVTFQDANGCQNTRTITIGTGAGLSGSISQTPSSCPSVNNGSITVTPTTGTAPYTFALDGGTPQASNIFSGVSSGSHTVVFRDANNCTGTLTVTVGTGAGITGTFTKTDAACAGVNNGTITITPTLGTAPYQYSLNAGPNQPGNTFSNLAPGTYTASFTDANGCSGTITNIIIGQGGPLSSTFVTNNPPCSNINNGSVVITATSGTAPYQFSLDGGAPQASGTFNGLAPGPHTYSFTDALGCSGTGSITLTTNPAITATIATVMPLCNGNANGSITITAGGGVSTYDYSKDLGATYQPSGTFSGLAAGTYTFRIRDNVGCTKDTTVTLAEPTLLTASAATIASTCNGNDGTITVSGGGGTVTYQYSINNGINYQASNIFTVAPGTYPNIKVKDANGCITNTTATVILTDNMFLNAGRDTTICVGQSITFQPQTNPQTNIYKWRPNSTIANDSLKNAVATPIDTTRYILNAKWGACQREDTITVNVLHKPVANAGNDTTICYNTFAVLRGSASNLSGGVNYTWSPAADILLPNLRVTIVNPKGAGLHAYMLTVTDNYGCNFSVTDVINVTVNIPPPAFAGNDTIAVKGIPHQLYGSGGTNYLWTPPGTLDNPFAKNPKATLFNDTRFILLVTDNAGCIAIDTVFVKVYEGPTYYIPNTFTPNGDGLNDVFRPIPVGISKTDWFRIFNRYGEQIFETNQWLKGWDGTFKGKPQGNGVYIWIIKGTDRNGKTVEMKGTVMLAR